MARPEWKDYCLASQSFHAKCRVSPALRGPDSFSRKQTCGMRVPQRTVQLRLGVPNKLLAPWKERWKKKRNCKIELKVLSNKIH